MTEPEVLDCERALRLLAAYLDRELGIDEERDMARHLERCRGCYSRAEFERRLKAQLGALRVASVSTLFEQRIRGLLDRFGR